jgi:cytochrome P450
MLRIVPALWSMEPLEAYLARGPAIRRTPVPGLANVVAVWDRDAVQKLFTSGNDVLRAGELQVQLLGGLGSESVMVIDGDRHMRMRRMLLPPFHGEALRSYANVIEEVTREEIDRWPVGEEFPTHPAMHRIVLEVLLRAVVGVSDQRRADRLRKLLPKVLEVSALTFIAEGRYPSLGTGPLARLQPWVRARREAVALLREEVAAHRAMPEQADDVLGMLIAARDEDGGALTDAEIMDQLHTLLVAGHQTTGATLAWCWERIVRHPDVLARMTREAREGDEGYIDAVLKETQRVRPAVEVTWRVLNQPMELCGYELPADTIVMPVFRMVQGRDNYADAHEFRPERYLDGTKHPPYTWIPFGGGTRRCIGAAFAMMEMRIIVATVLERFDVDVATRPAERRTRIRIFTTVPARGARITVRPRLTEPTRAPAQREPAPAA